MLRFPSFPIPTKVVSVFRNRTFIHGLGIGAESVIASYAKKNIFKCVYFLPFSFLVLVSDVLLGGMLKACDCEIFTVKEPGVHYFLSFTCVAHFVCQAVNSLFRLRN